MRRQGSGENGSEATIAAQAGSDGGCKHRMDLGCALEDEKKPNRTHRTKGLDGRRQSRRKGKRSNRHSWLFSRALGTDGAIHRAVRHRETFPGKMAKRRISLGHILNLISHLNLCE